MDTKACYRRFAARYLALGAAGITAGFIAVTPTVATPAAPAHEVKKDPQGPTSFADRLSAVRSAVAEHLDGQLKLAQIIHPPLPPPPILRPFTDVFRNEGRQPFSDAFRNVRPTPPAPTPPPPTPSTPTPPPRLG